MSTLPNDLINSLRALFRQCDEFATNERLQAVFNCRELGCYRDRLPEANSLESRIQLTIEYLLRQHKTIDGNWVILTFLTVLEGKYPLEHGIHVGIHKALTDILQELSEDSDGIEIPFVTLAMTKNEAHELFSGDNFQPIDGIDIETFRYFTNSLMDPQDNILDHYDNERDYWKPYKNDRADTSVESLAKGLLEDVNYFRRNKKQAEVFANFHTKQFFDEDVNTWDYLYDRGCIVIADALSLFHQNVWSAYDRSTIRNRKEKVALFVLSPSIAFKTSTREYLDEFLRSHLKWHYTEFEQNLLRLYEFNLGDLMSFKRRLFMLLPETIRILQNQQPDPESIVSLTRYQRTSVASVLFRE